MSELLRSTCAFILMVVLVAFFSPGAVASPADLNADMAVDAADLALFQMAYSGPGIQAFPGEFNVDFDADGDVDLADGAFMQASLSGAGRPAPFMPPEADAVVAWTLHGPTQVAAGAPLPWSASVRVTGDSQGLALYDFSLVLRDSQGNLVNVGWGETTFTSSFSVGGQSGSVIDSSDAGGPGFGFFQQPTTVLNSYTPAGILNGVGAAVALNEGAFDPAVMRAGVGLDFAKSSLLRDADGDGSKTDELYVLNSGWLDTSLLTPGERYTLTLVPGAANVLRSDADLTVLQTGYFAAMAGQATGSSFTFVTPEPASVLMMVPCVAWLRRGRRSV